MTLSLHWLFFLCGYFNMRHSLGYDIHSFPRFGIQSGLIPLALHVDGAEFYANSEFLVWSISSIFPDGHCWDTKFPICIVPHERLGTDAIKKDVHTMVANVVAWSLRHSASGIGPSRGFQGEPLENDYRKSLAGKELAGGFKACFFGFRFDEKARKECNFFTRSYNHSYICMRCMAQRQHKDWIPELSYKEMGECAAHRMTPVSQPLSFHWIHLSAPVLRRFRMTQNKNFPIQIPKISWRPSAARFQRLLEVRKSVTLGAGGWVEPANSIS